MDLLSICIPTYNRRDRLRGLLKKLCLWNKDNIKIIVIDNASTDGTDKMIKEFDKYKNLLYFRNDVNLGHDGNYFRIIEEGKRYSKYSLWLGDDDCVTKEFFKDIPILLEDKRPDVILLNSLFYINNLIKRYIYILFNKKLRLLPNRSDIIETNIENFCKNYINKIPFGTCIVNNKLIDLDKLDKYKETYHLYAGAVWEALDEVNKNEGKVLCYITSKPYIIWGKGSKSYKDIMKDVCIGIGKWYAMLPKSIKVVSDNEIKRIVESKEYGDKSKFIWESYLKYIGKKDD